jgi:DNA polymerase III subunit delta
MKPVYLVSGEDPNLRADALRHLVARLLGGDDPSMAVEEFDLATRGDEAEDGGTGAAVAAALGAAQTPPFGSERRIVILREAGLLGAEDGEALAAYLADPLPTTVVVLVTGGGRLPAALTKAFKASGGEEVTPPAERTGDTLTVHLKAAGVSLSPAAVRRVSDWLGDDAGRVPALLDVLRAAYGERAQLEPDDVEPYLAESGRVAPYQLTGAIDRGDTAAALEILHRLRGAGGMHPLQVMVLLHRHYQRLLRLDDPTITGESEAVAALGGKVKPYPAALALRQSRLLGSAGVRTAYGHLAKADLDLRGATAASEDAVLEILVARLAGISRRAGAQSTPARARTGRR